MSTIADYQIITRIYESANSLVYRAQFNTNDRPVILKVLKQDYPTPSELTRYKQEYEITRSLDIAGAIVAYDLLPYENTLAIVLEDFGAQSLDVLMQSQRFSLVEFLQIAIQTAAALTEIHGANIIHKDINPSNIILNPETGQVKIIDFGISTLFARENPLLKNPDVLEGTLAYMSPEQTGRMNRSLDYRTDFYSLGATFYKILTQQLLFETQDALELVHCHLARDPVPPHEIDASIPKTISQIVMKLLAKTAEDRYQSALGLKADLEECDRQLEQTGKISDFPLARQDVVERLQIPQKLYGRETEIEQLLATFKRATQLETQSEENETISSEKQVEMVLVGGYSGVGKTALIQELYRPLSQQRGYFIAGKFDQFQRNIPYSAVIAAFQSLVRQLLAESEAQLNQWREALKTALGINGQVIIDVIPEIEQIIGAQPALQALEPTQAQNRFNQVFQNFVRVFCRRSHPLVLFLDDLQWADFGTLKLIELMMTDRQIESLLLLGAYRDNEVDINHPTIVAIERLKSQKAIVNQIILEPLKLEDVAQLLAETLNCDRKTVDPLTELVLQKTSGNPFFVNEFLRTIYQENILIFNRDRKCWQWDISQIKALGITDNVVDLMLGNLRTLSEETQIVLRLSACIGNHFDLNTLSIIAEQSPSETFRELLPAIQEGLVQPTSEIKTTPETPIASTLVIQDYQFRHDRIQQAAYALIDRDRRTIVHLQIGRLLLANFDRDEQQERVFTLVDHLNKGLKLIEDKEEKIKVLELNLAAGKKAKEAIAYTAAQDYLRIARNEFPGDIWAERYTMALDLHKQLAEIEYLNGNFSESQALVKHSIDRVREPIDSTDFYILQIIQHTLHGKGEEAIALGRIALQNMGINLPEGDLKAALEEELIEYRKNLGDRSIGEMYNNPEMEIPEQQAIVKILTRLFSTAWMINPTLTSIIGCKLVNINIKYGHTSSSIVSYAMFATITNHVFKKYRDGYELTSLSMRLAARYQTLIPGGTIHNIHANMSMPWIEHVRFSEQVSDEAIDINAKIGFFQGLGYTQTYKIYTLIYQGQNLEILLREAERSLYFSQETQNHWATNCTLAAKIVLKNLMSETQNRLCFALEELPESDFLERCKQTQTMAAICFYQTFKAQALYLYEQPVPLSLLEQSARLFDYIPATISIAKHNFYYSLVLIAHYPEASSDKKQEYWQKVETNQKEMRTWADNCPENFLHKYLLVAAEIARLSGQWQEAMNLYDRAIESAKEHEFIHNEALGNELAAKFWLQLDKEDFAKSYLRKAHQGYQIWGAKRKVEQLEEKYPQWFVSQSSDSQGAISKTPTETTTGRATESLDLATVIKASQTLSGEIILGQLLARLMRLAIENAGAQKGFLLLPAQDETKALAIEAEGTAESETVPVLQSTSIDTLDPGTQLPRLSAAIINYVTRSQESVVLNDAVNEGQFTRDPYIIKVQPKSVLCTPLLNQGQLSGVLYLENNLTTGAFTADRIELLNILSSQAAISIENSRLYRTLEQKVEERTRELSQTLDVLKATQAELVLENALLRSDEQAQAYNYQVGGSLPLNAPTYVVRSADRYLYKALKQGNPCYILNARQMGKSSLMVRMMHHLRQEGHRCVVLDMTYIGSDEVTPAQWYKGLAVELWQSLDLMDSIRLGAWWKERQELSVVQRLGQFFEEVMRVLGDELEQQDRRLIIFLDEIDNVLSLKFPVNDFFALIRALYNQRAVNPVYNRLAFALFGVAVPADLITDRKRTPFNIGHPIELNGFQPHEAQPLSYGLSEKVENPQVVLNEVLSWTGGQPFLTQKLCQMIRDSSAAIPINTEAEWVENLVQTRILEHWESQDEPQHLKTIRDRMLESERSSQLLDLYQQILEQEEVAATDSIQERELLLSGIAVKQLGQLKVYNRIYQTVFDAAWLEAQRVMA